MQIVSAKKTFPSRPNVRAAYFVFKSLQSDQQGFSLLELVVVVVVLGILSSVTLPKIGDVISSSQIDEAKSLLNMTAADCIQKSRLNSRDKDTIDETIVSDQRLSSIGFQIDKSNKADKCSYFQIIPTNENDGIRFPFGFSVSGGELSKFANPTSTDKGSIRSCERWAGVNCKQDQSLKKLVDWKNKIAAAKTTCETNYSTWLTQKNTQPLEYKRWNPNADTGCPARPPKDGSTSYMTDPTCTTNGCNRTVYGLDGKFVGFTREDYDRALEEKYGKACTEWVANRKSIRYTNNPQNKPAKLQECGSQEFWFYKGVDVGTQAEFNKRICSDNLETEKKKAGIRTVQGCGDELYYFSDNKIWDSEKDYKESECSVYKYKQSKEGKDGKFTTTEKGATGCGDFWVCEGDVYDTEEKYLEKCKKEIKPETCPPKPSRICDRRPGHRICTEVKPGFKQSYSECMGLI